MIRKYEGMFLVSPTAGDGDKPLEPVRRVLDRAGAEVLVCKKWDERKLAYEVGGQKRGTYVVTFFKAEGAKVADIERDVQLSEELLRVMVLEASDVTDEEMNKPTPSETGESPTVELPSGMPERGGYGDRDRGDRGGGGGWRRDRDREPAAGPAGVDAPGDDGAGR
ncbi:MAG: 30S ribosomal protein S6 [Phycisphaerae bacterium]|nr:30S ribosomal protein S6 [Phycisphaerae bacterium]